MELWTFHRYRRPQLCVDAIEHEASTPVVLLRTGPQTYRLAFDNVDSAEQIAAELATLRSCDAPLWSVLRESAPDSAWFTLGTFLDTHSMIGEAHDSAVEQLTVQRTRIQECVAGTAAAVLEEMPAERRARIAAHAIFLRQELRSAAAKKAFFSSDIDAFDAEAQPNCFLALLVVEFEYLRRSSPLTLAAVHTLLNRIAGESEQLIDGEISEIFSEAGGLYDERDLEAHLWLVASCLTLSSSADAARFPLPPIPVSPLCSGLEFMRRTELLTRNTMALWGPNRYVSALKQLDDPNSPLIAGPYIEQYHVTRRFVEIIAPLLSKRLASPLRQMMFRYFSEEVGHEALESTTCAALGVTQRALNVAVPLPLHFAFVDALTVLAEIDPIASFAAIMVIEGVFGEPPRMSLRLAAVGRTNPTFRDVSQDHDELNESLNHNSISRDAFENISAVSPERQALAIRRVLFLLELNHRAWNAIADFYGRQKILSLQGPLGHPLDPQV